MHMEKRTIGQLETDSRIANAAMMRALFSTSAPFRNSVVSNKTRFCNDHFAVGFEFIGEKTKDVKLLSRPNPRSSSTAKLEGRSSSRLEGTKA